MVKKAQAINPKRKRDFEIRLELGKGLILLANLAIGSLLFGQAVSEQRFNSGIAFAGFLLMPFLYLLALRVMKGGE